MAAVGRVLRRRSSAIGRSLSWKKSNPVIHSTSLTRDWCIHRRGSTHCDSSWSSCTQSSRVTSCTASLCFDHCFVFVGRAIIATSCIHVRNKIQEQLNPEQRTVTKALRSVGWASWDTPVSRSHGSFMCTVTFICYRALTILTVSKQLHRKAWLSINLSFGFNHIIYFT